MTYKELRRYLDCLNEDELSRDVSVKLDDELYPLITSAYFVDKGESKLFDNGQLLLRIN